MVFYDVSSFPPYIDINTWLSLYKEGLVLFDGKSGSVPFKFDDDRISLIDISELSSGEIEEIGEAIEKANRKSIRDDRDEQTAIRENNERLVKYLKSINDGIDPSELIKGLK